MNLHLPDVTLIAASSPYYKIREHIHALEKSMQGIVFGTVKVIMEASIKDIDSWNRFICYDLWKYVDTSHAFLFHHDGYITSPDKWDDRWLKYDWISAPWPLPQDDYSYRTPNGELVRVGNSVGLRSRKLLKLPTDLDLEFKPFWGNTNEDGKFCVEWRDIFLDQGIKYAPFEEALDFGKEWELPEHEGRETFCFHTPG